MDRGMFRIYRCPKCSNIGYQSVQSENEESQCSLCGTLILDEPGTIYAVTKEEARSNVRELVVESRRKSSQKSSGRGLGVKKRLYYIVEALVDLNRGRPVAIDEVMRECTDAGIDLSRAMSFLDTLISEGMIESDGMSVRLTRGTW